MFTLVCDASGDLLLPVRVTPKSGKNEVLPWKDGDTTLNVKVTAPPAEGEANAAVIKLLASVLDLPKSRIALIAGDTSRMKRFRLSCGSANEQARLLKQLEAVLKCPVTVSG